MKKSKKSSLLLELLEEINEKDFKKICQLAESSYWNISKKDIALMKQLKDAEEEKRIAIYDQRQKTDSKFKYQKEKMITVIEDYILLQQCHQTTTLRDSILARLYGKKALDKNYRKRIKSYKKSLLDRPLDTDTGFLHYKYYELLATHPKVKRKRTQELSYMKESLQRFFIDNELRLIVEETNQKKITGTEMPLKKDFMPIKHPNTIQEIYFYFYKLLQNGKDTQAYDYLKNLFLQGKEPLAMSEWQTICIHLMNYTVQKLNKGIKNYNKDYLLFTDISLSKGYLFQNNLLDHGRYRNIFLNYLIAAPNNLEKAATFLKQYADDLNHPYKDVVKEIHLVYLLILKDQYQQAEENLSKISYVYLLDLPLQIFYKKLQLMLAYTLKESRYSFDLLLKNYDNFIRNQYRLRGKGNDQQKIKREFCLNFAKLIRRLSLEKFTYLDLQKFPPTTSDIIWFERQLGRR